MPSESDDPIKQAGLGVNWLVGLSGAAIGGALTKLDWILKLPKCDKILLFIAAVLLLISIVAGVFYAFELFVVKQRKLRLDEENAKAPPDGTVVNKLKAQLQDAGRKTALYHHTTLGSFFLAGITVVVCFSAVLFYCPPVPEPPKTVLSNHFTVTSVSVTQHGRVTHTHTFLLNQQTGQIWLMTCGPDNKSVEFRRVPTFKLDGSPEDEKGLEKPIETKPRK